MKIIHIFGPEEGPEEGEGLWTVEYEGESLNAFEQLLSLWQDPETAANALMDEAVELLGLLVRLAKRRSISGILQYVFKPLNNFETNITVLQLSKASSKTKTQNNPKLRVYAVRIGQNTYVVTGGAIKLTDRMEDRPHTVRQLQRLKMVRDWLNREGIFYPGDLTDLP
jgi:hypothetical protein